MFFKIKRINKLIFLLFFSVWCKQKITAGSELLEAPRKASEGSPPPCS